MSARTLIIQSTATGSSPVTIPVHGNVAGLTQTYTELRSQTLYRYLDGSAAVRRGWSGKVRTEVQGRGLVPPGLAAVCNATGTVTLSCIGHRSVRSASRVITLPSARRTDSGSTWYAREWLGDTWEAATGTATGNTITLATGPSGCHYEIVFFPKLIGYVSLDAENYTQNDGFGWSLTLEEA